MASTRAIEGKGMVSAPQLDCGYLRNAKVPFSSAAGIRFESR